MAIFTLNDLKTYLNIETSGTSENTQKLQWIVNGVNQTIVNYVGRELASAEYIENYDGTGTEALPLKNFPITEITSVKLRGLVVPEWSGWEGTDLASYPYSTETMGWYLRDDGSSGILWNRYCWPNGRNIITVSYTAGYETIPPDIFLGALEMAAYYRNITQKPGVVSEFLGQYSVNLMSSLSATNFDLSIASPVFRLALDEERSRTAKEFVF